MEPKPISYHITLGNLANFFLDELLHNPSISFHDLLHKAFTHLPLDIAALNDEFFDQKRRLQHDLEIHYNHLKNFVIRFYPNKKPIIEPSFYSRKFGLHGRLDLFYSNENQGSIVELKSGNDNHGQIKTNHLVQVVLYRLLISSVYPNLDQISSSVLYSRTGNLIKANSTEELVQNALLARNQIVIFEKSIAKNDLTGLNFFFNQPPKVVNIDFGQKSWISLQAKFQQADELAQKYILGFMGFIFREHFLERIGNPEDERNRGLAGLWLQSYEKKANDFNLLAGLEVKENLSNQESSVVIFQKTALTDTMANFRSGDSVLVYPYNPAMPDAFLSHQIFRGILTENNPMEIKILLNNKQNQPNAFDADQQWVVERDSSDRSARIYLKGLYSFLDASPQIKRLILGLDFPKKPNKSPIDLPPDLPVEKRKVLSAMIGSQDYYLLWGPPGTGKTSVVIKEFVRYLFNNSQENILLLAYTNRAVDEICEALEGVCDFLKIGHHHNTAPVWHKNLLSHRAKSIKTRRELIDLIQRSRIFVGTLSALADKPEIFSLKQFDTLLVDEASQIHEPLLLALLNRAKRFILIGDHKQLPAVVLQSLEESKVMDEDLIQMGLTNYGNSMFERLYKNAQNQQIHWAFGQLRQQGRMHQDIMALPNRFFYANSLEVLEEKNYQSNPLSIKENDPLGLSERRLIFLSTPIDTENRHSKLNIHEANLVAQIIEWINPLTDHCVGVITPFRAQIACIKNSLTAKGLDPNMISVDTVERYQGGARRIIIYSLCSNSSQHLDASISLSDEGIDRKLNVAITRAREQIILVGNKELLMDHPVYAPILQSGLFFSRDL
jgi:DNA replication ATP-dependent helicase Dna2